MNIPPNLSEILVLGSNTILIGAAAIAILRFREQCERLERFWSSPTGAAISDDKERRLRQQLVSNLRLEKQVLALQECIDALASNQSSPAAAPDRPLPIDNAARMARNGASIEQLTQTCGLNVGEAQLMKRLHGSQPSPA